MRSDAVKTGTQQAPHRSLFNALGMTKEEMDRPLVGIVSSYNEIVPGHMNLDKITQAVKLGVAMAGGTPVMFPAIAVCDGIAMGHVGMKYSLVTRDLIADSTEAMAMAHQFDALVMIPNCDKNVPGLLMAAARLNVPTVFVSGGPMLAGHLNGHKTSLSSMFEAVGAYAAGKLDEDGLTECEMKTCPTCGSCSGMYTANSMNCLTEVLGMGLKGNGTIPAVYSERIRLAKHAGMQVMEMYRKNIRPRDIMTKEAILNALTVDMALGCSTNSMLHLPAIAHEIGMDFDISFANEISAKTPNLCHLAPAGPTYLRLAEHAGGKKTVMISIMPCTAKKAEAVRPNSFTDGEQDTDIVITTTELLRMIDNFGLDFATLDPEACDMPFGFGSGGGVIFGVTGGVTEAVLRRLTPDHSKETMHEIAECGVRGDEGIKEFTVPYEGMNLNICVASGLANARTVMEQVKNGEKEYHLIEIMACRRGCIMGGGQPTRSGDRTKALRAKGLYNADNTTIIKKSDENPLVLELYNGLLKGKEHHLLHNDSY